MGERKPERGAGYTELCKNIPVRFWEWLAEILRHSAVLGLAAEHVEDESQECFYTALYI